jgi:Asp-tRNA(Asn)/Glu-tRNA(Gln) amidotransferase B subunit
LSKEEVAWTPEMVPPRKLADILKLLREKQITYSSAKDLMNEVLHDKAATVLDIANTKGFLEQEVSENTYRAAIQRVIQANDELINDITKKGKRGKVMGLVGMTLRELEKSKKPGMIRPERLKQMIVDELNLE